MKPLLKKIVIVAGIGFVVAVGIAVYMYNKPHQNIAKAKAEYSLSAEILANEFQQAENEANEKYLGKIIEIRGPVVGIEKSADGSVSVSLHDFFSGVTCTINATDAAAYASGINGLQEGDEVTFKGRCDGMLTDVRISDCVLVE